MISILRYGLIAGLVVVVPMLYLMLTSTSPESGPHSSALYGYLTMIFALTAVFLGIKHYRDHVLGGVIKFVPALAVGLGISAVASIVYVIGWELALAWTGADVAQFYGNMMIEAARSANVSAPDLQKAMEEAASFVRMYRNPLYRMPMTFIEMFPVGVLISLISAALLRNSRLLPASSRYEEAK